MNETISSANKVWRDALKKYPKTIKTQRALSVGEELLALHLRASGIVDYKREFFFHPERRWRFDFAWESLKLAVEVEGGVGRFSQKSRHTSYVGFENDIEKYNTATLLGWHVLRFTMANIKTGDALTTIEKLRLRLYNGKSL